MERLTVRNSEGIGVLKQPFECERCGDLQWSLPDLGNGSPIDRLAEYEDLEERLNQVYGECDGLLEKVIEHLERHEGIDLPEPVFKARLLTDGEVDRWDEYKSLEEQGKLPKLPCAVGDTVYVIPSKTNYNLNIINGYSENNRVYEQVVNRIEISENGYLLVTCDGMASVIDAFYRNTWFLTRKEAESALKELQEVK